MANTGQTATALELTKSGSDESQIPQPEDIVGCLAAVDDVELHLDQDIYNFYLLFRETEEYTQLPLVFRIRLIALVSVCLFVQATGLLAVLTADKTLNDMEFTTIDCPSDNIFYSDCVITESRNDYIYKQKMDFPNYLARFASVALLACYIYPISISVPVYSVKLLQIWNRKRDKYKQTLTLWSLLICMQLLLLIGVSAAVLEIIFKSTSILDVMSSGIGFIIILEIDSFMFNSVYRNNSHIRQIIEKNHLFRIILKEKDRDSTIFSKSRCVLFRFSVDGYGLSSLFIVLFATSVWIVQCSWYSMGFDRNNPNKGDEALFYILIHMGTVIASCWLFLPFCALLSGKLCVR